MPGALSSLIIPAYNEATRLRTGFERLLQADREGKIDLRQIEVIYVDDGSTDATPQIAKQITESVPHGQLLVLDANRGKGAAIRAGVASASTPMLAFIDADFAIDPRQLPDLFGILATHAVGIGSRAVRGHVDYGNPLRTIAGRSFNRLIRTLSKVDFRDTQCGFKGLRSAHAKVLFHLTSIQRFAFDVEILARAQSLHWSIGEVPVSWQDVSGSQVHLAKDTTTMLSELLEARRRFAELPPLFALDAPSQLPYERLVGDVAGVGIAAWPILASPSGTRTILATLHEPDLAMGQLESLGRHWSTTPRTLQISELTRAGQDGLWILGDTPPARPLGFS